MKTDIDIEKLDNILDECFKKLNTDPKKAKQLAQQVIDLAQESNLRERLGKAYTYLALAVYHTDGASNAIDISKKAIKNLTNFGNSSSLGMAWLYFGICKRSLGEAIDSMRCYQKAKKIYKKCNDHKGEAATLNNIGIIYKKMGFVDQALSCYKQSNDIAIYIGNKTLQAVTLNNIALLLIDEGEIEQANVYLEQGIAINREGNRKIGMIHCLISMGIIHIQKNNLKEAEKYLLEANLLWKDIGNKNLIIPSLHSLAEVYQKQNKISKSIDILNKALDFSTDIDNSAFIGQTKLKLGKIFFEQDKFREAEQHLLNALELLKGKEEATEYLKEGCELLAKYYENQKDYQNSLDFYKLYIGYQRELTEKKIEHDLEKMTLRSKFQTSEIKRNILLKKNNELAKLNRKLQQALDKVKLLQGMLPICANCKKIRTDEGYWEQIEKYLGEHSEAVFTHGLCPECIKIYFSDIAEVSENL